MELEKVCGLKRAAQLLDLSEHRVRRLTKQGRIAHCLDDGGRYKFVITDIKRLARQRKKSGRRS